MKIMLIDDDRDLCHLTKLILTKYGYDVAVALDAAAGLQYARHYAPNLILMDVMMPGVGGPDAVKIIQTDPQLKGVPIVFLTALLTGQENDRENQEFNVGGSNYPALGKPFEIEGLLNIVQKYSKQNG